VSDNSVIARHADNGILRVVAATAQPTRLLLLRLLAEQESDVQECARRTGLTPRRVRHHLTTLATAGLIQARPENGSEFYRLADPERVQSLLAAAERLTWSASTSSG
jgi:DNA-binding transcriptional ArsR family regulator